ncbi:MAG: hypothetical protein HY561_08095 [Gemmatimonadetes bacterium]|nr:hypothetical protein [Gemmatimonadota bacterium]
MWLRIPCTLSAAALLLEWIPTAAAAEPYLAVRTGLQCSQCHTNRTGGGGRNAFGNIYGQTRLPLRPTGFRGRSLNDFAAVGGNLRVAAFGTIGRSTPRAAVEIDESNVQLELRPVADRLTVYFDETLGPAGASAREAFVLLEGLPANGYVKAGKFLLPYGLRLPDDREFIREQTGFTYDTPDQGLELGIEPGSLTIVVALSNGSQGAAEADDAKQITGSVALALRRLRLGASASRNEGGGSRRTVLGGYAGVSTGRITLLGEADLVRDDGAASGRVERLAAYVEGDVLLRRGLNVKLTYGFLDPDTEIAENARVRARFGVEAFPVAFLQLSAFYTLLQDIPQARTDVDRVSLEMHAYF